MSKTSKQRFCPAVGREITSADCGENRVSRYTCPADCPHSPFTPANYGRLLEIEGALDNKTIGRVLSDATNRRAMERQLATLVESGSGHAMHAFIEWEGFFRTDEEGRTCVQRWERASFPGLKNDERVLMRAKMQTRVALLEVRRVCDAERTEVVDLLEPGGGPFVVQDRGFASQAVRFASALTWIYPLPNCWRLAGTAIVLQDMTPFDPLEVVLEVARHLGAPADGPELRRWLAEHFIRFDEALLAVGEARFQAMLTAMDVQAGRVVYDLKAPREECRDILDSVSNVEEESPTPAERREGFTGGRVWFETAAESVVAFPDNHQPVLGRVLMGLRQWRLEAMSAGQLAKLRERFEALLGHRVQFVCESLDDLASRLAPKRKPYDQRLVPPRLLEHAPRVVLASARAEAPASDRSDEAASTEFFASNDRAFLDTLVPVLDNRTPREAARDPTLRPKLVRLIKSRVRRHDEQNLRTGRTDDINWLIRELGLSELLVEAPPARPPTELGAELEEHAEDDSLEADEGEDEGEASNQTEGENLPAPPTMPAEPLTFDEARERLRETLTPFDTAEDALEHLAAGGSRLTEEIHRLTEEMLTQEEFSFLMTFLVPVWFLFAPPGHRSPALAWSGVETTLERELSRVDMAVLAGPDRAFDALIEGCRQPMLTRLLVGKLIEVAPIAPTSVPLRPEAQAVMIAVVKVLVDELDRVVGRSHPLKG